MRMRKLLSPDNSTNTSAQLLLLVSITPAQQQQQRQQPGGHGGNITLFRNRHYNPGNGKKSYSIDTIQRIRVDRICIKQLQRVGVGRKSLENL